MKHTISETCLTTTLAVLFGSMAPVVSQSEAPDKTIQAEFIRLSGVFLVIRKDGREFTLPLANLSTRKPKQAVDLAARTNPVPR